MFSCLIVFKMHSLADNWSDAPWSDAPWTDPSTDRPFNGKNGFRYTVLNNES